MPLGVPPQPKKLQPLSCALDTLVTRAVPISEPAELKYVWYIVTVVVSAAFWSIRAKPPSPKSARVQVPAGCKKFVPLSCVPPMLKLRSLGWTAMLWNWVALKPAVLRLVQVAPLSVLRHTPPSLPTHNTLVFDGANASACMSGCRPVSDRVKAVPSVEWMRSDDAQVPVRSAEPPSQMTFGSVGLITIGSSYQH